MLQLHHVHRVAHGTEDGHGFGPATVDGVFQSDDVREKDVLLFHHVRGQLSGHRLECLLDLAQFWMALSMDRDHFVQELLKTRESPVSRRHGEC